MNYLLAVLVLCGASFADSIPFVVQQNGATQVSLAGDPLVGPSYAISARLGGAYLQFGSVLPEGSGTMSLTIDGVTQTVSLTSDGSSVIQGFNIPRNIYQPTDATLTIDMNGQVSTYSFQVVCPVAEPSTWILMLSGLGWLAKRYRYE